MEPYAKKPKPRPNRIKPIENFIGPEGLYFEAQILEKIGAKSIMNSEFKTENQDAGISVAS
tara:strand:+ start:490 stop:672 length:183 start_codon:yes stop_codon:yes gene_type:complete